MCPVPLLCHLKTLYGFRHITEKSCKIPLSYKYYLRKSVIVFRRVFVVGGWVCGRMVAAEHFNTLFCTSFCSTRLQKGECGHRFDEAKSVWINSETTSGR